MVKKLACDMTLQEFQDKLDNIKSIFSQHGIRPEDITIHFGDVCGQKDMRELKIEYMMTIRHTGAESSAILVKLPKNIVF